MANHFTNLAANGNHVITRFEFLSVADMLAFTNEQSGVLTKCALAALTVADVGSIAQVGAAIPFDYYVLRDHTVPTWDIIHGLGIAPETSGEALLLGDVLTVEATTGAMVKANATFSSGEWEVVAISLEAVGAAAAVNVAQSGTKVPILFGAAPPAASNGDRVFLSATSGEAALVPPAGGNRVIFVLGVLQGADGITATPDVFFRPHYISRRP